MPGTYLQSPRSSSLSPGSRKPAPPRPAPRPDTLAGQYAIERRQDTERMRGAIAAAFPLRRGRR